jgi:hypothetical protein
VDEKERRLAQNEALFREVNERVSDVSTEWTGDGSGLETLGLVCECGRQTCTKTLSIPRAVYEDVRRNGARFIIVPGHEIEDVEHVVERSDTYSVVEKVGEAKRYAEHLDPRSR